MSMIKEERHRQAIRHAVRHRSNKFWADGDSAPHLIETTWPRGNMRPGKHSHLAPSGVFCATIEVEAYAIVFDEEGALFNERFDNFIWRNACDFYGLEPGLQELTFAEEKWTIGNPVTVPGIGHMFPMFYEPEPERRTKILWKIQTA